MKNIQDYIAEPVAQTAVVIDNATTLKNYVTQLQTLQTEIDQNLLLVATHGQICLERARKAGAVLMECRKLVPRGEFLKWLGINITFIKQATAYRYMDLADLSPVINLDECKGLDDAYKQIEDHRKQTQEPKENPPGRKPREKNPMDQVRALLNKVEILFKETDCKTQIIAETEVHLADWKKEAVNIVEAVPFNSTPVIQTFTTKSTIDDFIKRIIFVADEARWTVNDGALTFHETSSDKKFLGSITMKTFDYSGDRKQLVISSKNIKDYLGCFDKKDRLTFKTESEEPDKLMISNGALNISYWQESVSHLKPQPSPINLAAATNYLEILLDKETVKKIEAVLLSMKNDWHFFLVPMGDKVELVKGYSKTIKINTVSTGPLVISGQPLKDPMAFKASALLNILKTNPELINQTLKVSETGGLLWTECGNDLIHAEYYLIKVDYED